MLKSKYKWISVKDAATKLNITERTLSKWRANGKGPKYKTERGIVKYEADSVSAHVNKHQTNGFAKYEPVVLNWKAPAITQHKE